jgi:serine/threonine-protein kinase
MGASPLDPNDPLVGMVLAGRYRVERRIGEGGMGLVYEGVHREIDKRVAIKVLRNDLSKRPEVVARFRQEAKSASRIGHEHIVDTFDFGETAEGSSYFVMEFLEGEDLANVLGREATLEASRACAIVLQCCKALGATHAKGIVHRDIKPENIFLVNRGGVDDFVKIVDFGIAKMSDIETDGEPGRKLTKTGMIFGTPEYMSPEQAAGKALDHRVDVYALGIILYECFAGRVPFEGDTFMGVLTKHMFAELPPIREINPKAEVRPELELVVAKALAKNPDDRYQDTEELAEAIRCALEGRLSPATAMATPSTAAAPSLESFDRVPKRKSSHWAWAAGLAAVGVVAWAAFGSVKSQDDRMAAAVEVVEVADLETSDPPLQLVEPAPTEPLDEPADATPVPSLVQVHVATDPDGAAVRSSDGSYVCAKAPCTLEVTPGETVVLRARLGRRRGRAAVTATEDETVLIDLRAPARAARPVSAPRVQKRAPERGTPVRASDLKIPEWAQ